MIQRSRDHKLTRSPHRSQQTHCCALLHDVFSRKLRSWVRVKNDSPRLTFLGEERHLQGCDNEFITHMVLTSVADNASGMFISDRAKVGNTPALDTDLRVDDRYLTFG